MTTPGGETTGGAVNLGELLPPLLESPDVVARNIFNASLIGQAERHAPGVASAEWHAWPQKIEPGDALVPPLVRIGSVSDGTAAQEPLPILIPAAGESHVLFGAPSLAKTTLKGEVPYGVDPLTVPAIKREIEAEHRQAELGRLQLLAAERGAAIAAMRGVMLRTLAAMRPGALQLRVYSPDNGADFRSFSALGGPESGNIYQLETRIHPYLVRLANRIHFMHSEGLRGADSLREYAQASRSGQLPRPFVLATMIGSGESLPSADARLLHLILTEGPDCGITLLAHGFDISDGTPHTHRVAPPANAPAGDLRVTTSAAANIPFWIDGPPNRALTTTVAGIVADAQAERQARQPNHSPRTDRPNLRLVGGTEAGQASNRGLANAPLPGEQYRTAIGDGMAALRLARQEVARYRRAFPLIEAEHANTLVKSDQNYLQYVADVAADPSTLGRDLSQRHRPEDQLERLQTWAALQLVRSSPGNKWNHVRQAWHNTSGTQLLAAAMPNLIQVVSITAHHGQELLPYSMRDWAAQSLPEDPPAYIFQLVADHGTRRTLPGAETGYEEGALRATILHLESTYGAQLHSLNGRIDSRLLQALVECEIIRLYRADQPESPDAVRDLVVRRSHRRLEAINRDELPSSARPFYDACMDRLKIIGRIDTLSETTRHTAGAVASVALRTAIEGLKAVGFAQLGLQPPENEKGDATDGTAKA